MLSTIEIVTEQAEWDSIRTRIPTELLPPGYTPNFATSILVYLQSGDDDANSYIRLASALENMDKSVDMGFEKCGGPVAGIVTHIPFALYSLQKPIGAIRTNGIQSGPPNCFTPR